MKINGSLVSVLINCHNGSAFLKNAIDSIYAQSYENWEVVFIDNASNDSSREIVESYDSKIKYYYLKSKKSLGAARNIALSKATGHYIAFLDCDDEFLPNKLQNQVSLMKKYDLDMCYGSTYHIDHNSKVLRKKKVSNYQGRMFNKLLIKYNINMQTVMIKKQFLDKHNLSFDKSLLFSPDYDLFMEIALIGKSASIKNYLSKYRLHFDSLTTKSQHLIAPEGMYTLDRLDKIYNISNEFNFAFKYAKSVFRTQDSIFYLQKNDSFKAKKSLKKDYKFNPKAIFLLLLLKLKISPKLILNLIGRSK